MGIPEPVLADMTWQVILEQAAGPFAVIDLRGRFAYVNPAECRLLGYDRDELIGRVPRDFTHPDDFAVDQDAIEQVIQSPVDTVEVEKRFLRPDGSVVWALVTSSIIRDAEGRPMFYLSQTHDITARRELERRWQRTVTNAPIGMALVDLQGYYTEVNDRLCDMLGYHRDELRGKHFTEFTYPADLHSGADVFADVVEGRRDTMSMERRFRHRDGHPFWMLIRVSVVPDADGRPAYLVSQFETIGGERLNDRNLVHMALYDPLTGLANRALLLDLLQRELSELSDEGDGTLAVLLIDLDNLKPTNDRYGHAAGDKLLIAAADELLQAVRASDTVARLGGDEFVVVNKVKNFEDAEVFRHRIARRFDTELTVSGQHLDLRASVGVAATENPSTSPEELLDSADRDMYAHKRRVPD